MSTFEEILDKDGKLVYKTKGSSMKPMLYQDRDLVVIQPPKGRLAEYDVALYRVGKRYIMHRVISVNEDGTYLIRGDHTYTDEIVPEGAVIGVLTEFVRKGKQYNITNPGYQRYVRFWCSVYPIRRVNAKMKWWVKGIVKKVLQR